MSNGRGRYRETKKRMEMEQIERIKQARESLEKTLADASEKFVASRNPLMKSYYEGQRDALNFAVEIVKIWEK